SGQLLEDGAARRVGQGLEDVVLGHDDTLATTYFKRKQSMNNEPSDQLWHRPHPAPDVGAAKNCSLPHTTTPK
ncbi:MAG: hypothetical protein ACN6OP_21435, partial [Pseudomonadales bacterium]